jgi:hypothetical protein
MTKINKILEMVDLTLVDHFPGMKTSLETLKVGTKTKFDPINGYTP